MQPNQFAIIKTINLYSKLCKENTIEPTIAIRIEWYMNNMKMARRKRKLIFLLYEVSSSWSLWSIPILLKDGIKHTANQVKANVLNYHFSTVFTHDGEAPLPELVLAHIQVCQILTLTSQELLTFLKRLILRKQLDPIAILQKCWKNGWRTLPKPNIDIYCLPATRKDTPALEEGLGNFLFKRGDQTNPMNYRLVSLTSICSTLCTRTHYPFKFHVSLKYLYINSDDQYGFCKRQSEEI